MPHQCTNCGRTFEDGSKEMLAGCPDCDGNKFQFIPKGREVPADAGGTSPSTAGANAAGGSTAGANAAGSSTAATDRTPTGGSTRSEGVSADAASPQARDGIEGDTAAGSGTADGAADAAADATADGATEDDAQSSARSSFVSSTELEEAKRKMAAAEERRMAEVEGDAAAAGGPAEPVAETGEEVESPSLDALRAELNDQFESIKIKAPGQYELNLMELYDREEYIISLREDGRYVIEMPETWRDDE